MIKLPDLTTAIALPALPDLAYTAHDGSAVLISGIEYADLPPANWHILIVLRCDVRGSDWAGHVVNLDPEGHWPRNARQHFIRVPGKHRSRAAARAVLEHMMSKRRWQH